MTYPGVGAIYKSPSYVREHLFILLSVFLRFYGGDAIGLTNLSLPTGIDGKPALSASTLGKYLNPCLMSGHLITSSAGKVLFSFDITFGTCATWISCVCLPHSYHALEAKNRGSRPNRQAASERANGWKGACHAMPHDQIICLSFPLCLYLFLT